MSAPTSAEARRQHKLLKVVEVAELWDCSTHHVYDLIAAGQLKAVNLSAGQRAKLRIREADLDRFIDARST